MFNVILLTGLDDPLNPSKPLGAYKCAQVLRDAGYTCLVVDHIQTYSEKDLTELLSKAVSDDTYLLGVSTTFLPESIIDFVANLCPNVKIAVGGAKANPNETNKNIDYVVIGYAEQSIVNVVEHIATGSPVPSSYKSVYSPVIVDDRKAEGYNFVNSVIDWQPEDVVNQTVLPLEVARGCIFKCKFCAYPMNGKQQLDFVKTEQSLQRELERNYNEYGIYKYFLVDDTFNDNDYKLDKILAVVKKLKFQPEFWAYTRLDLIARQVNKNISKLFDIGLRATHFGIETLNEETGRLIGKGYSQQKQIEAVQYIRNKFKDQIQMHGSFIVGLPHESNESCIRTFEMLQSQQLPLHSWSFQPLTISNPNRFAWNSSISLNLEDYGYKTNATNESWIDWSNEHTTYQDAIVLANELNNGSRENKQMGCYAGLAWAMQAFGKDITELTTSLAETDFYRITIQKKSFVSAYKHQLLKILNTR